MNPAVVCPPPSRCHHDLLASALQASVGHWHKARRQAVAAAVLALVHSRSVQLGELASHFGGAKDTLIESNQRRLSRLLREHTGLYPDPGQDQLDGSLARLLADWSGAPGPWVLSLDRSDWQPPAAVRARLPWVNFLVLAIVHEGVAYPLLWTVRPQAGSSAVAERIELFERFLALFGAAQVDYVAQDREFGHSVQWQAYLESRRVDYRMRLPQDVCVSLAPASAAAAAGTDAGMGAAAAAGAPSCPLGELVADLPASAGPVQLAGARWVLGQRVYVSVLRLPAAPAARSQAAKGKKGHQQRGDEWVIVAASAARAEQRWARAQNCAHELAQRDALAGQAARCQRRGSAWAQPVAAALAAARPAAVARAAAAAAAGWLDLLGDYKQRWPIETLFGALKSRGFELEQTHLEHPERLGRLFGLVSLAYTWAQRTGQWLDACGLGPRRVAKTGRRVLSLFRAGVRYLRGLLRPAAVRRPETWARFAQSLRALARAGQWQAYAY